MTIPRKIDPDLMAQMWRDGVPLPEIADYFGCTKPAVCQAARRAGLPGRGNGPHRYGPGLRHSKIDEPTLRRMWAEGKTSVECAAVWGCASNTILARVKALGLTPLINPRRCAVPGCGAVLAQSSVSSVCKEHTHVRPHCQCKRCIDGAEITISLLELRLMAEVGMSLPEAARKMGVRYVIAHNAASRSGIKFADARLKKVAAMVVPAEAPPPVQSNVTPLQDALSARGGTVRARIDIAREFGVSHDEVCAAMPRLRR